MKVVSIAWREGTDVPRQLLSVYFHDGDDSRGRRPMTHVWLAAEAIPMTEIEPPKLGEEWSPAGHAGELRAL